LNHVPHEQHALDKLETQGRSKNRTEIKLSNIKCDSIAHTRGHWNSKAGENHNNKKEISIRGENLNVSQS